MGPEQRTAGEPTSYRPPMAVGQQYPPLGYAPDGSPRFAVGADPVAGTSPPQQPPTGPPQQPPTSYSPPPRRDRDASKTAFGIAGVIVLVVLVVAALRFVNSPDNRDRVPPRADPPASQNTDDPYLPKSIEPTETVPGEPTRPPGGGIRAELSVEAAPGSSVIYIDGDQVLMGRMSTGTWKETVDASRGIVRVNVISKPGTPASCTVTIDGRRVAHEEIAADDPTGMVTCRAGT